MSLTFAMAGGGTGGHIIPALAVARELQERGHQVFFVGTRTGMESKLVPAAGFAIEYIDIGGLNRVSRLRRLKTVAQLPLSIIQVWKLLGRKRAAAVFSMGGYVAGPVVLAAVLRGIPVVLMEPNAIPGLTNRWVAKRAAMALVNFPATLAWFPPGRAEVTGVPVRREFFQPARERSLPSTFTVLVTGGSQGSRTLNNAARDSWPLFAQSRLSVRLIHQAGKNVAEEFAEAFRKTGLAGEVSAFIPDMPAAFAAADLVVCRSGASTVSELAAAGKASLLVPFPYAADDHQQKNAEALALAGAALVVTDREMTGERLYREVSELLAQPGRLRKMGESARAFARPDAARRAADVLESAAVR
jgi:UDP-N-acetylglucosamine--N-acetylmuramyl-(pentapeptide) pyrophosphoryl-undecaprenol N-acetylglucosamine transferase